jgi:hypothetical protein
MAKSSRRVAAKIISEEDARLAAQTDVIPGAITNCVIDIPGSREEITLSSINIRTGKSYAEVPYRIRPESVESKVEEVMRDALRKARYEAERGRKFPITVRYNVRTPFEAPNMYKSDGALNPK